MNPCRDRNERNNQRYQRRQRHGNTLIEQTLVQRLILRRVAWIAWGCVGTLVTSDAAFGGGFSRPRQRSDALRYRNNPTVAWSLSSVMDTTTISISEPSGDCDEPCSNWRMLPKPTTETASEDVCLQQKQLESSVLSRRVVWSDEAYTEGCKLYDEFMACSDSYVAGRIQASLVCIDHAFRLYGPDSVICSFNGGKDAVVIFHLLRAALAAYYRQCTTVSAQKHRPRVVYFDHPEEFAEIQDFLRDTVDRYDLDMICFAQGTKFQDGLRVLIAHNTPHCDPPMVAPTNVVLPMAFVLGTRLTDPNAKDQQHFAPSSHYMPPFMRVNPVLDWTYGHVWHFLRLYGLPYCKLYDQGYTSLGTVKDTLPCPALAVAGQDTSTTTTTSSIPKYWPAYMLRDWDQERAGRLTKDEPKKAKLAPKVAVSTSPLTDELEPSVTSASSIGHLSTMSDGRKLQSGDDLPPTSIKAVDTAPATVEVEDDCVSYSADDVVQKTAGILIIGDEILKGFTADTNTQVAATALRDNNVVLKSVVVVPDTLDEIVREIQRLRTMVDVVITSGGVGATHDDVTMKSVAAALHCDMELHDEMAQLLRDKMNQKTDATKDTVELTEAQVKMATLPTVSKLRYLSKNPDDWPVLQCKNIFILPGIPEFFSKKIRNVAEYLSCQLERSPAYKIVLQVDENSIVPVLNQVVENHPNVTFGSYPFVSHPEYKTVITVEGRLLPSLAMRNSTIFDHEMLADTSTKSRDADVQLALNDLITRLPEGSVLRVDVDDMRLFS